MGSDDKALFPVVVQDAVSRQVLMLAYADETALKLTRETGLAHFYSRSRKRLWKKGETSGHILPVREILTDCDHDAYLYLADRSNPVCHRNTASCFGEGGAVLPEPLGLLDHIIRTRLSGPRDETSYTWALMAGEPHRLIQKVGEEAVEVVIAASYAERGAQEAEDSLVGEISDLLYHLSVLMRRLNIPLDAVSAELLKRHSDRSGDEAIRTKPV